MTPPINSVSDHILQGIAAGDLAASPFEVVSIAKELAARRAANTPVGGVDQNLAREVHNLRKRLKGYIVNRGKHLDDRGAKDLSRASELLSAKFPASPALPSQVVGVNLSDAATESRQRGFTLVLLEAVEVAIDNLDSCNSALEDVDPKTFFGRIAEALFVLRAASNATRQP